MHKHKTIYQSAFIVLLAFTIMVCPLATGITSQKQYVYAQGPQFTPSVATVEFDETITPVPFEPFDPLFQTATVSGNFITIGDFTYQIGARFTDASDIKLGSTHKNFLFNFFGHATILAQGASEYRLIWTIDVDFTKQFMITKVDNPLFDGQNGFLENFVWLTEEEDKLKATVGTGLGAAGTVIAVDLGLCPATAGGGCAKAAFVAFLAGIGASVVTIWFFFNDILPAMSNVNDAFVNLEINTP
jgi:hypothetical protein